MSVVYYQNVLEIDTLTDIVSNTEKRCIKPQFSDELHEFSASLPVQCAEGLVKNDEARRPSQHGPPESHTLSFATGDKRATLTKPGLQALRQFSEQGYQICLLHNFADATN
jgi:hypothetical protein